MARRRDAWAAAAALVRHYVLDVDEFWTGAMQRQAVKLHRQLRSLERQHGWSAPEVVRRLDAVTRERHPEPPPGVYVTGLGGSGSHWLAAMLAELPEVVDVGEVYFSVQLRDALADLSTAAARRFVVDAVQLLHGLPKRLDIAAATTVNSAAGAYEIEQYRAWDPRAVVVYLHRDPRDQVLSAVFRKDEYRAYLAPEAEDRDYLLRMCARNRADLVRYRATGLRADLEIGYEALRRDAAPALATVMAALGRQVGDEAIEQAVATHDAAAIRAGRAAATGNLDLGGRSRGWQDDADRDLRELLHVELAETVVGLGYPLVECLRDADGHEPVRWDGRDRGVVLCAAGADEVTDEVVPSLLERAPRVLDLSRTAVTDGVTDVLIASGSLEVVGLHGTSVTRAGRAALVAARPDLRVRS